MTLTEFFYWQAYLQEHPVEEPANSRTTAILEGLHRAAASIMAVVTNMSGKTLRKGQHVDADYFLGEGTRAQTAEEQIAFFKSLGE